MPRERHDNAIRVYFSNLLIKFDDESTTVSEGILRLIQHKMSQESWQYSDRIIWLMFLWSLFACEK